MRNPGLFFSLALASLCAWPMAAHATDKAGNGGKGIVCRDSAGQVVSAELLDYFEAKIRGIPIDLGAPGLTVQQKLDLALNRLDPRDHFRAQAYRSRVADFFNPANSKFLKGVTLEDTQDSYEIAIPEGCDVENLVVRKEPQFPEDRLWTVSQDLWDKLDNDNRAGLVLHEVIYDELLTTTSQTNSINARYYNSYLSSDKLAAMGTLDYLTLMTRLGFDKITLDGLDVSVSQPQPIFYDGSDRPKELGLYGDGNAITVENTSVPIDGVIDLYPNGNPQRISLSNSITASVNGQKLPITAGAEFFEDGRFKSVQLAQPSNVIVGGQKLLAGSDENTGPGPFPENVVEFNPYGSVADLSLSAPQPYSWHGSTHILGCNVIGHEVRFYSNGVPSTIGCLSDAISFDVYGGSLQFPAALPAFELYPSGRLKSFTTGSAIRLTSDLFSEDTSNASFYDDGFPQMIQAANGSSGWIRVGASVVHFHLDQDPDPLGGGEMNFFPNRMPQQISASSTDELDVTEQAKKLGICGTMVFNDDGSLGFGFFCTPDWFDADSVQFTVQGQTTAFSKTNPHNSGPAQIGFYPGGILQVGILAQDATFQDGSGNPQRVPKGSTVSFDRAGRLTNFYNY